MEVSAAILRAAFSPTVATRLMFLSFTYSRQFRTYAQALVEKGLLSYDPTTRVYLITDKGREFLELYESMSEDAGFLQEARAREEVA